MEQLLTLLGIKNFTNSKYTFKPKKVDILGDDDPILITPQIEIWEVEGGYKNLNILIKVDESWSTALSIKYINNDLYDSTKIGNYIGDQFTHQLELSFMNGFENDDSYYFSSDYDTSKQIFKLILDLLGSLEIDNVVVKEVPTSYVPYKAYYLLKDNIEENVKDRTDIEEVIEVAQIFMEYHGEDYRALLFNDSRLIFRSEEDQIIVDLIEDIMFEYFNEDEVLVEDDWF